MMSRRTLTTILVICLAAGCASPSTGVTPTHATGAPTREPASAPRPTIDPTVPLSLEDCLRLAETNDVTARAFLGRLEAARSLVDTAETFPNPTFNYSVSDVGVIDRDRRRTLQQVQTLGYPVFTFWTKGLESDLARAQLDRDAASIDEDRRQLRLEVGRTFFELLGEAELVLLAEQAATIAAKSAEAIVQQAELGRSSGFDEKRAVAERIETQRDLEAARHRLEVDRLGFSLALGSEQPVPVRLAPGWPEGLPLGLVPAESGSVGSAVLTLPLQQAVERALATRPDMARARGEALRAATGMDLEDRRAIPLADWTVAAGAQESQNGVGGVLSVGGPIPLLDRNQGPRRRARAELEQASADLEQTRRRVTSEIETAFLAWSRAQARVESFGRPLLKAREDALKAAEETFAAGRLSYLDLLSAQRDAVSARRALVGAQRDVALQRWRLVVAANGP
jgi:outer membrane protein TolC